MGAQTVAVRAPLLRAHAGGSQVPGRL